MPQINLTVVAETAEELKGILLDLADIVDATATVVAESTGVGAVALGDAPKKRGRGRPAGSKNKSTTPVDPTPEEREAAEREVKRIAAESDIERVETDKVEAAAAKVVAGTPADVAVVAPLPPTPPAPAEPAPVVAPKVGVDAAREALKVLVKAKGRDAAMAILREFSAEKLADITDEAHFAAIVAKAQAAAA